MKHFVFLILIVFHGACLQRIKENESRNIDEVVSPVISKTLENCLRDYRTNAPIHKVDIPVPVIYEVMFDTMRSDTIMQILAGPGISQNIGNPEIVPVGMFSLDSIQVCIQDKKTNGFGSSFYKKDLMDSTLLNAYLKQKHYPILQRNLVCWIYKIQGDQAFFQKSVKF